MKLEETYKNCIHDIGLDPFFIHFYTSELIHLYRAYSKSSERHDNIATTSGSKMDKSGVPPPKETCCDMSLALLSAIVCSFTQYSSLNEYINVCSLFIFEYNSHHSFWLAKCYIRIDVSHFVKNVTKWSPFKTVSKRVKLTVIVQPQKN